MQAIFIGRDTEANDLWITKAVIHPIELDPKGTFETMVQVSETYDDTRYAALGERYRSGLKLVGYVVSFYEIEGDNEKLIGVAGSSEQFKRMAGTPQLGEMLAFYQEQLEKEAAAASRMPTTAQPQR